MNQTTTGYMGKMADHSRAMAKVLREQAAQNVPPPADEETPEVAPDQEEPEAPEQTQDTGDETPDPSAVPANDGAEESEEEPAQDDQPDVQQDPFAAAIVGYLELLDKSSTEKEELVEYIENVDVSTMGGAAARAFVDQNLSSLSLLDETVVVEIRKQLKRASTTDDLIAQLEEMLDRYPEMSEAIQRLVAAGPDKSNLFRQLLAALCSGAVVPSNVGGEVYVPRKKSDEQPILILRPICTLNWGYVDCGPVSLTASSPEEYLSDSERSKLTNGAPEERRVLRNRVFVESVSDQLGGGTYVILAISPNEPKWELVSWTSEIFRDSYEAGDLEVIESAPGPDGELAVGEDGDWVTMVPWQMAIVGEDTQLAPVTGEVRREKSIVAQMFGNRFVWIGTAQDFGGIGANVGERVVKIDDEAKAKEIRRNVPDARERLLGRR